MKNNKFIITIFLIFTLSSCLSENHIFEDPGVDFIPETFKWESITKEVSYSKVEIPDFPLIYHIVKIDLSSSNLDIIEFYENGTKSDHAVLISELNKNLHPMVLTNTAPFAYSNRLALKFSWMPSTYKTIGIHKSKGVVKAPPVGHYCALTFSKKNEGFYQAEIFDSQDDEGISETDFAFGGFFTILRDYETISFPANNYDSRNGCGISADGKIIYLLEVEGERQNKSIGLSYPACAQIFLELGCKDAMQFDGGGTTCLYVNGKNMLTYKPFRKSPAYFGFTVSEYQPSLK